MCILNSGGFVTEDLEQEVDPMLNSSLVALEVTLVMRVFLYFYPELILSGCSHTDKSFGGVPIL